jgi:hypothetical protein
MVLALGASVVALGACKSDSPAVSTGGPSSTRSSSTAAPSSSTPTSAACAFSPDDEAKPASATRAELGAVRAAGHGGVDQVVFEFSGAAPGYRVGYEAKPVREDGSGAEVALAGGFALAVRMDNASAYHLEGDASHPTYTGPKRISPSGTANVVELVNNGDFEGVLSWTLGVRDKAGFKVTLLSSPPRLVVDVCA